MMICDGFLLSGLEFYVKTSWWTKLSPADTIESVIIGQVGKSTALIFSDF